MKSHSSAVLIIRALLVRDMMASGVSAFGSLWTGHFMTGLVPAGMNGNMFSSVQIPLYVECAIKCELTH